MSYIFSTKDRRISHINVRNFNETLLTNNVVSFEQPGPEGQKYVRFYLSETWQVQSTLNTTFLWL